MADSVDITLDVSGWDTDFTRVHTYDAAVRRITTDGLGSTVDRLRRLAAFPDSIRGIEFNIDQLTRALAAAGRTADALALVTAAADVAKTSTMHAALARALEVAGNPAAARASVAHALALDSLETRALELNRRLRPAP